MKTLTILAVLLLAGCAHVPEAVIPQTSLVVEHVSHISQHFGSNPTNYGYDTASVDLQWKIGKHFFVDASEGAVIEKRDGASCGGLWGPREVTQVRAGFIINPK